MLSVLRLFLSTVFSVFRSRAALQVENLALRHQIGVLRRPAETSQVDHGGPSLLGVVVWCLGRLEIRAGHRQTRDCACRKLRAGRNALRTRESEGTKCYQGFASSEGIQDSPRGHQWRLVLKSEETPVAAHLFCGGQTLSPPFSGCASLVTVMEAAHLRDSHDASEFWWLHRPRLGRVLGQRKMCSGPVIICRE